MKAPTPAAASPLVSIVDDDLSVRESLLDLFESAGYVARAYSNATEFLSSGRVRDSKCLVLDVRMPGGDGPDLFDALRAAGHRVPVVFISGHGDANLRDRVLRAGASEFLSKPFNESDLLAAVQRAIGTGAAYG